MSTNALGSFVYTGAGASDLRRSGRSFLQVVHSFVSKRAGATQVADADDELLLEE